MPFRALLKSIYIAILLALPLFISQCKEVHASPKSTSFSDLITLEVNPSKTYQTIDNFGASDAWSCQFIGNWPDSKKNAIADLLFSKDVSADGHPLGIGLSLWRFNIGAGSSQQGDASGIKDEWRRAESFLTSANVYDWSKQAGQVWFLEAAKKRGVDQFLAFTNSPPVNFTINSKAYASSGKPNLSSGKFDDFSKFLTSVVSGIQSKTGILFNYISPVNEPQWDWSDGGQEGTPFSNGDISSIVKSLDAALTEKNLTSKIIVTEAGQYEYLYSDNGKPGRGKQIDSLFNKQSPYYIGDLLHTEKAVTGHSYFTTSPYAKAVAIRKSLAQSIASTPLRFWQSEYCILGDNEGEIKGEKRDLGIDPALYLARVIHNDLTVANATAWQWWLSISPYDYKDGLIYVDKSTTDGSFYASKMLWGLGNYSRFIQPGAQRIEVSSDNLHEGDPSLLVSSYKDLKTNQLTTIIVNSGLQLTKIKLNVVNGNIKNVRVYTTSADKNLEPSLPDQDGLVSILPRSIVTLTGNIN